MVEEFKFEPKIRYAIRYKDLFLYSDGPDCCFIKLSATLNPSCFWSTQSLPDAINRLKELQKRSSYINQCGIRCPLIRDEIKIIELKSTMTAVDCDDQSIHRQNLIDEVSKKLKQISLAKLTTPELEQALIIVNRGFENAITK